MKAKIVI